MDFISLFKESISTLKVNKMRTGLAVLGIVIGIGSVITLVSLGQSSQRAISNQIQSLGSNMLTVIPGSQSSGGVRGASGGGTTLTKDDATAIINASLSSVKSVSPEITSRTQVVAGRNNTNTQVVGVTAAYASIRNITLSTGSFISDKDVSSISKVAVLGSQAALDLFGESATPLGQSIRIQNQTLTVVGIAKSKGGTGFNNPDDMIYVPLSTASKQLFGQDHLSSISIEAKSANQMVQAQDEVGYLLLARHKITDPTSADFSIFSQNDILSTASSVTGTFTALLSGIAAISLLVGGIGIMNIMLVTVTERTREIGLRKALGARQKLIITQFLIEATLLTVIGGIAGVVLGVGASYIISKFLSTPFVASVSSILLSLGVSCVIGIVFGWYPAYKASKLQPIEALRYE